MSMHLHVAPPSERNAAAALRASGDMRRHRRLQLSLAGRFMRANRSEHVCQLKDISVGGASVVTTTTPDVGERVIVYFDHLGGFDGTVTRATADGFALQFKVTEHKREKLAAQIMWLVNRETFPDEFGRLHERRGTGGRRSTLKFDDGVIIDVELLDLSASGASIGTSAKPPIGSPVLVGKLAAIVRRHHAQGLGVQFVTVQSDDSLREAFP